MISHPFDERCQVKVKDFRLTRQTPTHDTDAGKAGLDDTLTEDSRLETKALSQALRNYMDDWTFAVTSNSPQPAPASPRAVFRLSIGGPDDI